MMVRRETGHIETDLGDDHAGDDGTDARDVRQSIDVLSKGLEPLLKPPVDGVNRALDRIDLVEMQSKQESMILGHAAPQRGLQLLGRRFQLTFELDQALWPCLAGDDCLKDRATRLAQNVADHAG
jgi:hypothetical protein